MPFDANGNKKTSADVVAWANLWLYANPIFVRLTGSNPLLLEVNGAKAGAQTLAVAQ